MKGEKVRYKDASPYFFIYVFFSELDVPQRQRVHEPDEKSLLEWTFIVNRLILLTLSLGTSGFATLDFINNN